MIKSHRWDTQFLLKYFYEIKHWRVLPPLELELPQLKEERIYYFLPFHDARKLRRNRSRTVRNSFSRVRLVVFTRQLVKFEELRYRERDSFDVNGKIDMSSVRNYTFVRCG